jgi:hypothetical protein
LAEDNGNGNGQSTPPVAVEFNWPLYVYKRRLTGRDDYLYSLAVWRGVTLVSICHLQPLDVAVSALADILRSGNHAEPAGISAKPAIPVQGNGRS